jgi:hypothetical protein
MITKKDQARLRLKGVITGVMRWQIITKKKLLGSLIERRGSGKYNLYLRIVGE